MRYLKLLQRTLAIFLGITFLCYGTIKLLGGQFLYHGFSIDSATTDGPTLVWAFYGYSPVYGRLIGVAELVPALLLLWPRTRTLGALLILPVAANITVMDFCFNFPAVKYLALALTLMAVVLVVLEAKRLRQVAAVLLTPERATLPSATATAIPAAGRKRRVVVYGAGFVLAGCGALLLVNLLVGTLSDPVAAAYACCQEKGWPHDDLVMKRWIMKSGAVGFRPAGFVEFETRAAHEPRTIHVGVYRPINLVSWQITDYEETPGTVH